MSALIGGPGLLLPALAPISLAELTERAALLTRVDRKYVLAVADLPLVWAALPEDARVLQIDGERVVGYRSTYFDTGTLDSYRAAAHGRPRRWKVRTRSYSTGATFLEVKLRRRSRTVKERVAWPVGPDAVSLDPAQQAFVGDRLAAVGSPADAADLAPSLITSFRRTTVYLPGSQARATVDDNLVWATPDGTRRGRLRGHVVVETKSGRAPSVLDRALWAHGHRPWRLSKYAVGLASLTRGLPHNRWHRTLTTLRAALMVEAA